MLHKPGSLTFHFVFLQYLCSNPVFVVPLSPVNQPCASMPDVENNQIIPFQFWLQSKTPWKCLLIFRALQNLLPFGPQALWRGGRPCGNEVWPRGKLPLYWLWKKQIWEQQQNIWEAFLLQVEVVTKSVEGVVTLHVLWRGGEGRAAGVLVYFSRRHDRELPCTDTQTHTFSSWSQPITVEQPRCDAGSVPTTPGPWTSSTLPSEVVIFQ